MGDFVITIIGRGSHHNENNPTDANRMAERFVNKLLATGHTIEIANFTAGGKTDLLFQNIDNQEVIDDGKDFVLEDKLEYPQFPGVLYKNTD